MSVLDNCIEGLTAEIKELTKEVEAIKCEFDRSKDKLVTKEMTLSFLERLRVLESRKGMHWIESNGSYACDRCKCDTAVDKYGMLFDYCPSCGAKREFDNNAADYITDKNQLG